MASTNRFPVSIKKVWFIPSLFLVLASADLRQPTHALYLSVTELTLLHTGQSSVSIKVFSDDLQNALRNYSSDYKPGGLNQFLEKNLTQAQHYFSEHLEIKINNRTVQLKMKKFTIENDAHFINFCFTSPRSPETLEVKADFLMELFPTQTNVIKVQLEQEQWYLKCVKGAEHQILTWSR